MSHLHSLFHPSFYCCSKLLESWMLLKSAAKVKSHIDFGQELHLHKSIDPLYLQFHVSVLPEVKHGSDPFLWIRRICALWTSSDHSTIYSISLFSVLGSFFLCGWCLRPSPFVGLFFICLSLPIFFLTKSMWQKGHQHPFETCSSVTVTTKRGFIFSRVPRNCLTPKQQGNPPASH